MNELLDSTLLKPFCIPGDIAKENSLFKFIFRFLIQSLLDFHPNHISPLIMYVSEYHYAQAEQSSLANYHSLFNLFDVNNCLVNVLVFASYLSI